MKKKTWVAGAAVVIVVLAVGSSLFRKEEEEVVNVLPVVETICPELGSIYLYTDLTGEVEPEEVVYIYPEAAGTVTEVVVKAGDQVSEGQKLCMIDTKQVESAENAMETAQLALQEARTELSRQQILYASGDISRQAYENYANTAERARLSYESAKLNYDNQVSYSQVTAPISGVVESCDVEVFDKVTTGVSLCVISGAGGKVLSTGLTEQLKDALQIGDEIEVKKNGNCYRGVVYEISSMADVSTGLYNMKCRMEGDNPLSTGSVVKITFVSEKAEQVLTIPVDAVYYDNGTPYLFTYDEGTIHKKFIETGIYDSERIEVLSGLDPESMVILTWSPELYEGASVTLNTVEGGATE